MSEAGKSKQIKCKDLLLIDKILDIDEFEKKTLQSAVAKNLKYRNYRSRRFLVQKKNFHLFIVAT